MLITVHGFAIMFVNQLIIAFKCGEKQKHFKSMQLKFILPFVFVCIQLLDTDTVHVRKNLKRRQSQSTQQIFVRYIFCCLWLLCFQYVNTIDCTVHTHGSSQQDLWILCFPPFNFFISFIDFFLIIVQVKRLRVFSLSLGLFVLYERRGMRLFERVEYIHGILVLDDIESA